MEMETIKIGKSETQYAINSIRTLSANVLQADFADAVPREYGDITLYTSGGVYCATFTGYDTIYRQDGQTVWLSNDSSVYTEPAEPVMTDPEPTLDERKAARLAAASAACNAAITAGCDVTLSDKTTGHFALTETDQINLTAAVAAIQQGLAGYPYHADGELCRIYPAADILAIGSAAAGHKLYHTTYHNHLRAWIRRAKNVKELDAVYYGAELPVDLADHMTAILAQVGGAV